jgi:hypothetical protein
MKATRATRFLLLLDVGKTAPQIVLNNQKAKRDREFYLALTVIVVVLQEPTYPGGRLCDMILWPPGPMVVTLVANPALLQIDWARFNRTPIKLGTVH